MDKETLLEMLTPQMVLRIAATLIRDQQGAQHPAANKPAAQPSSPPAPATAATGVNLAASYGPGVSGPPTATTAKPTFAGASYGPGASGPDGSITYGVPVTATEQTPPPTTGQTPPTDRIEKLERELADIKGQMSTLIGLLQAGAS